MKTFYLRKMIFCIYRIILPLYQRCNRQEIRNFFCFFFFIVFAEPCVKLRMEIIHNSTETCCSFPHRFKQCRCICVVQFQIRSFDNFQLLSDLCNITAGIFQEIKSSCRCTPGNSFRCKQSLVRIRTLIKTKRNIRIHVFQNFFAVFDPHRIIFIFFCQTVSY